MNNKSMRIFTLGSLAATFLFFTSCKDDVETLTETSNGIKTSGYIVNTYSDSSAGSVNFAGYLEDKPQGGIDLTQYTSFNQFNPIEVYKNYSFGRPLDGGTGLSRFTVNEETAQIEETSIATEAGVGSVSIVSDELGLFSVNEVQKLFVFNPTTMKLLRSIDISNGKTIDGYYFTYLQIIYREQDNKAFMFLHLNDLETTQYYDANEVYVEVIDLDSFTWESTAVLTDAQYPFTRGSTNSVVDESGNIYVTCQGSYSLDGQAGVNAASASRPQIAKIPSGSTTFDESYRFNPANTLGYQGLVAQFVTGTVYGADGIAYAAVSAKDDSTRVLQLIYAYATGTITQEEFEELRLLVINGANSRWTKLDLNAQTATIIEDIPYTAGFGYPYSYNYGGKLFFEMFNLDEGINGYYEYDPETNTSSNLFNVTGGGVAAQLVKLEE